MAYKNAYRAMENYYNRMHCFVLAWTIARVRAGVQCSCLFLQGTQCSFVSERNAYVFVGLECNVPPDSSAMLIFL